MKTETTKNIKNYQNESKTKSIPRSCYLVWNIFYTLINWTSAHPNPKRNQVSQKEHFISGTLSLNQVDRENNLWKWSPIHHSSPNAGLLLFNSMLLLIKWGRLTSLVCKSIFILIRFTDRHRCASSSCQRNTGPRQSQGWHFSM